MSRQSPHLALPRAPGPFSLLTSSKTAIWSTRQCYDLTRLLILAHPIRAKFIRHIKIKWQARCGLNKRDSLIFSHPSQVPMGLDSSHVCNDLERPLKDLDGPGAKWRVKLNSFPTLPACRDISVDVWEEIGLDFIIRRLFDIAPNARRLCLDEGEADELGLPSRRPLRGRKTCHLPNSLESFELYSPLPGSRDILSGLLKGSAHLTCLTITGLSRGWVGYEKGISEAIIQDGDGIETLVADNTIIACMKSWPRDLQHLTGIYEEDLRAPYSLAELVGSVPASDDHTALTGVQAARIPATPARKLTLISTEGFGPDEFDVWEHLPHLPEQLAQPHATKTSFPSTMDHIASSCHVVDDLVLHAADRNPALIHLNLLTDLTGQRAIYQIYTYKRLNGDTCTRLLGQHREPSPALATWAGSVHDAIPINYSYDTAYVDRASFNGRFVLETELEQVWTLAGQRAQELWLTEPCREFYLPEETWEALERACPA